MVEAGRPPGGRAGFAVKGGGCCSDRSGAMAPTADHAGSGTPLPPPAGRVPAARSAGPDTGPDSVTGPAHTQNPARSILACLRPMPRPPPLFARKRKPLAVTSRRLPWRRRQGGAAAPARRVPPAPSTRARETRAWAQMHTPTRPLAACPASLPRAKGSASRPPPASPSILTLTSGFYRERRGFPVKGTPLGMGTSQGPGAEPPPARWPGLPRPRCCCRADSASPAG